MSLPSTAEARSLSSLPVIPRVNLHARENQYDFSVAMPSAAYPLLLEEQPTTTVTVTVKTEDSITITLSSAATTVTTFVTIPVSQNTASPSPVPTPSLGGLGPAKAIWVAPTKMDDLTPFGVAGSPGGKKNLQIVTTTSDDSTSILQILFPAGSIDPARKPQGGAEFYASPLDISGARNVTLKYSVYFPLDFDWVLAGKMPGLYGGHKGCSGGNAALDCFSTRLMWRKKGVGELYLVR